MDEKQRKFEESMKKAAGGQMMDASSIANSAMYLINNRAGDLGVNPIIPFLLVQRLAEKNIEHLKKSMLEDSTLKMLSMIFGEDTQEIIDRLETMADNMIEACAEERSLKPDQ